MIGHRILYAIPLLCGLFTSTTETFAQSPSGVRLQSEVTHVQPMTGIVLWSDNPVAAEQPNAVALEYRYCGYDEVVTSKGRYDFTKLDQVLDEISARGHQAVLRFYFCYPGKSTTVPQHVRKLAGYKETIGKSEGKKTHFCDWSHQGLQDFTLEFYSRLADRYDRDPRIAFLQTGFGLWAEYHIYDGPRKLGQTFPSKKFQTRFLKHLASEFESLPWSISVDAADYDYTPLEDNEELLALPFGVFDDSFLCRQHPKENAVNWKILGSERWKNQPAGGELSYYNRNDQKKALSPEGPNGVPLDKAAQQFHITYMIGNDQTHHSTVARIREASLQTGYRFQITEAEVVGDELRLSVTNTGVAPLYRHAWLELKGQKSEQSLKGLLPAQSREFVIRGVKLQDVVKLEIQSKATLPSRPIQFEADLLVQVRSP